MLQYNNQYSIKAIRKENKFLNLKLKKEETDELLSIQSFRKIDKANSISFKSKLYSIYDLIRIELALRKKHQY